MAQWRSDTEHEYKFLSLNIKRIFSWIEWYVDKRYKKEIEVTDCYRSDYEHRALLLRINKDYYPTPHSDNRALDFIIKGGTIKIYKDVEFMINLLFPYGKGRYKTAIYHSGTGYHIHIQTKPLL